MPIKILMPALSPTMTAGNLAKWLKNEGDKISPGEILAEIETDKATMELEAIDEGIIAKILIPAGSENIPVNQLIAIVLEEGEEYNALDELIASNQAIGSKSVSDLEITEHANPNAHFEKELHINVTNSQNSNSTNSTEKISSYAEQSQKALNSLTNESFEKEERIFASPLAKKIAKSQNIDLRQIKGSGPYGRIIKSDLEKVAISPQTASQKPIRGEIKRIAEEYRAVPNNNIRKIIAKRLCESKQTIPHFYLSIDCNVDKLLALRADINSATEDKQQKISVNDFVILAVSKALREVPEANASWDDSAIRYYNNIDISVAVAIDGGLITPVIRNAEQKDIMTLSNEMKALAKKARENKLTPEEFQGGGFSISNLGMYGIKNFNAIINPPQSCILAVGASNKKAIVLNDQIAIAEVMNVTLSSDHRVVDGAVGAKFLASFKKFIERPALLLIS